MRPQLDEFKVEEETPIVVGDRRKKEHWGLHNVWKREKCTSHGHDGSCNTYLPNLFQLHFLKVYIFTSVVDV